MKITVQKSGIANIITACGGTLHDALVQNGVELPSPCGGHGLCGKCRVIVPGTTAGEREASFFTPQQVREHWRLACLTPIFDGMVCIVPENGDAAIVTEGSGGQISLDPAVRLYPYALDVPALSDQRADAERLKTCVPYQTAPLSALAALPNQLRDAAFRGVAAVFEDTQSATVLLSAGTKNCFGVAVDIGTTTVAAYLINLVTGEQKDVLSCLNPQGSLGADVITRADYASRNENGLEELAGRIRHCIGSLCHEFTVRNGMELSDIYHITLCGNSIMMHLLAGLPVKNIAVSPFVPVYERQIHVPADALALPLPNAIASLLPCVAGYVGADTVAAVLASGMDQGDALTLLVDIGTNGEIVLGNREKLLCCSTAAGPAFEGAHIHCGMGGVAGAVCKVNEDLDYAVIGEGKAVGLCGSGLLDLVARLVETETVDFSGRIDEDMLPEKWKDRLTQWDGKPAFRLEGDILLTQKDVREVQLAKGAIAAGIEVLCKQMGVGVEAVERVCLAGGFGSRMDPQSACRIGLLPPELSDRIEAIGNGAGMGACMALRSREALLRAQSVRDQMQYLELSADKRFDDLFVDHMLFE